MHYINFIGLGKFATMRELTPHLSSFYIEITPVYSIKVFEMMKKSLSLLVIDNSVLLGPMNI